jgi:hypothetical protein
MGNYVEQRFPQFIRSSASLNATSEVFREACADYEEVCALLATQGAKLAICDPKHLAQARELEEDLAEEILKMLEEHNAFTG